jgi:putative NIF3 family GTP cyclohydrolase 1 type 2
MQVSAVVSALKTAVGSTWQDAEWDGLQAGSLDAEVTGVAVAWSPSIEVLKKAAEAGCNLLLTKTPLYWWEGESRRGGDSALSRLLEGTTGATAFTAIEAAPVYRHKRDIVTERKLNVVRVSENWNGPNAVPLRGMMDALGWTQQQVVIADPVVAPHARTAIVSLPTASLAQVAQRAKERLGARSVRVLGDRNASIARVAVHPGYLTISAIRGILATPGLDAVITGEANEWEAFPYAQDWVDAGRGKGFVMLGLAVTSDAAARVFADVVRAAVQPVRVQFLAVGDPFTAVHAGGLRT